MNGCPKEDVQNGRQDGASIREFSVLRMLEILDSRGRSRVVSEEDRAMIERKLAWLRTDSPTKLSAEEYSRLLENERGWKWLFYGHRSLNSFVHEQAIALAQLAGQERDRLPELAVKAIALDKFVRTKQGTAEKLGRIQLRMAISAVVAFAGMVGCAFVAPFIMLILACLTVACTVSVLIIGAYADKPIAPRRQDELSSLVWRLTNAL